MRDVGNGEMKLGMRSTTILSEDGGYTGTDCTDGLPHYSKSLICLSIWNEKKLTQTCGHANIKGVLACVV